MREGLNPLFPPPVLLAGTPGIHYRLWRGCFLRLLRLGFALRAGMPARWNPIGDRCL
jgi:hypothetical protein